MAASNKYISKATGYCRQVLTYFNCSGRYKPKLSLPPHDTMSPSKTAKHMTHSHASFIKLTSAMFTCVIFFVFNFKLLIVWKKWLTFKVRIKKNNFTSHKEYFLIDLGEKKGAEPRAHNRFETGTCVRENYPIPHGFKVKNQEQQQQQLFAFFHLRFAFI